MACCQKCSTFMTQQTPRRLPSLMSSSQASELEFLHRSKYGNGIVSIPILKQNDNKIHCKDTLCIFVCHQLSDCL